MINVFIFSVAHFSQWVFKYLYYLFSKIKKTNQQRKPFLKIINFLIINYNLEINNSNFD